MEKSNKKIRFFQDTQVSNLLSLSKEMEKRWLLNFFAMFGTVTKIYVTLRFFNQFSYFYEGILALIFNVENRNKPNIGFG